MAETKELILSLKIAGTAQQTAELKKLQTNLVLLRKRNSEINAQIKKGIPLSSGQRKAYRNLSTQIKATSTRIGQLNKQILINNGVMKKTSGLAGGIAKGFRTMALQIGGAMAAFALVKNVIGIFKDFQQANADLAAVLGKSRSEIVALTNDAKRLGAVTAFTASEVSKLQKEFAKLGFSEREILAATKATLDLAAATNTELVEAAKVAGATVRGFGLDASETQRVVDVMAKAFSSSALDMEKFSTAMGKIAPIAKAVGLTIEETTGFMGTLADSGIEASIIGTSLRRIFIELSKKGLTLTEALDQITNSQDKLNTANKIFGARAATAALVLAANADNAAILTDKLNAAGGAAKRMAEEQLDTLTGSTIKLSSAWEGFILGLEDGEGAFAGAIRGAIDLATSILRLSSTAQKSGKISTQSIIDENLRLNNLVDEYDVLIEKVNKTESEKSRLVTIVLELRDAFGDSVVVINKETGALELNRTELLKNLQSRLALEDESIKQEIRRKIEIERNLEGLENQIKLQSALTDAKKKAVETDVDTEKLGFDLIAIQRRENELNEAAVKDENKLNDLLGQQVELKFELVGIDSLLIKNGIDFDDLLKSQIGNLEGVTEATNDLTDAKKTALDKAAEKELQLQIKLIAELDKLEIAAIKDKRERRERELLFEFENRINSIQGNGEIENQLRIALRKQLNTDISALDDEFRLKKKDKQDELDTEDQLEQDELDLIKTDLTLQAAQGLADALFAIKKQARQREFNEALSSLREETTESSKILNDQFKEDKKALEDKLTAGVISQKQFDDKIFALEEALDDSKAILGTEAAEREETLRREAFEKQKKADFLDATIGIALAVIRGLSKPAIPPFPSAIAAGIAGAVQLAIISATKFNKGGLLRGKSHARGGIPTADGQMEFEGGEAVINKRSTAMFGAQLSAMNVAGGGVAFGRGGQTPIHRFQAGSITPVPAFTGRSITGQAGLDIDAMAERMGAEIAGQIGELRVINVVSDTTSGQLDIENTESEASFG